MAQAATAAGTSGGAFGHRATLLPGFDDPVDGAQAAFRAALQALANPGQVQVVDAACGVPAGLSPAMTALLLALADIDAPVWVPAGVDEAVRGFLRFHCACPLVDDPAQARFVAVPAGHAMPPLARCDAGDPAYPDRSATVLLDVDGLASGTSASALTLSGPGIPGSRVVSVAGLPDGFAAQWAANHALFPLGVDVFLTHGDQICGLPRTTRMEN
ncbi:phosphonate C-P lyase system protein PhnH [Bordetella genomosp. 9]|uniref:Phosphonate C-P lyase system protein PhnH n=1 Tax=Bordetella genomosp. 9 TaxID=1416803 RepID=A0A261RRL9_9BORD|nr:phosphonate C-P lyase system protein PhnH [Bordetella genomosp. 9]OZI26923.1 phosphonate C-P lyase system protein PhnH [Bordetella genomosp. 9]